ncbi:MAG: hypothetical protein F4190_13415 [Acidimicrobiales bacterium]|nr:hypothetical protein [Acidimicrobiales bacterium]MXY01378.1 hypothetical protein [Acidimicrobiales bacterium]MYA81817.1 hypothetical protein [Acidimicrobiales bacterium]MYD33415.1 hypothetical protein [Acidimicrobiales bacterium]MYG89502.1 hypothetical protein [Acidimicrobiales bacterium]
MSPRDDRSIGGHARRREDQPAHLDQIAPDTGREIRDAPAVEIAGVDRLGLHQVARSRFGRRRLGRRRSRCFGGRRCLGGGGGRRRSGRGRLGSRRGCSFGGSGGRGRIRFGLAASGSNERKRHKRHEKAVHPRTLWLLLAPPGPAETRRIG